MKLTKAVAFASMSFVTIVVSLLSFVAFNGTSGPADGSLAEQGALSLLRIRSFNFPSTNDGKNVAMDEITQTADVTENKSDIEVVDPIIGEIRRDVVSVTADATKQTCQKSFPLKCEMYPYVQFWNKILHKEDCYQSPLRHPLGGKAPPEEQKYVVFQPDNGGWNNIRMAAETVMIFAHATGRYKNHTYSSKSCIQKCIGVSSCH